MASTADLAVKRSVVRVIVLSILSVGLYGFYWFYVTRQQVTEEVGGNDAVGLQTVGLLVPILNWFIIYWLWRDINKLRTKETGQSFPVGLFLVLSILFGIAAIVIYPLVVSYLNEYWDKKTGGQATNAPVSGGEIAVVVVGLLLAVVWGVVLASTISSADSVNSVTNYNYNY